jgi:hypothetical protein
MTSRIDRNLLAAISAAAISLLALIVNIGITVPTNTRALDAYALSHAQLAFLIDALRALPIGLAALAGLLLVLVLASLKWGAAKHTRVAAPRRQTVVQAHAPSQRPERRTLVRRQKPLDQSFEREGGPW